MWKDYARLEAVCRRCGRVIDEFEFVTGGVQMKNDCCVGAYAPKEDRNYVFGGVDFRHVHAALYVNELSVRQNIGRSVDDRRRDALVGADGAFIAWTYHVGLRA